MTPERWQKLKHVFEDALPLEGEKRDKFLAESCAGDESLRREVEMLLQSHVEAKSFIERPAAEKVAGQILEREEAPLGAGQLVAHYKILGWLGAGGMGQVYLAEDSKLKRKVALKVLPADVAGNAERMRRFRQEAMAAAALNHPNIAHIYEVGEDNGVHFIAMEYVDGATLRQLIHERRTDLPKLLRYLKHVAEGLSRAHAGGIVHRDLKPDNVMVTRDGHAKILDFGLAKLVETQPLSSDGPESTAEPRSVPGAVLGTVGYMSPEQAQGKTDEIDQRSDIFSFGCLLFEAVTRKKAFAGTDIIDSLNKIIREPAPSITDLNPTAPADLQRIVRRCLAKEPERRYQSIKEVAIEIDDLRRELNSSAVEYSTPASSSAANKAQARQDASGTLLVATTEAQSATRAENFVDKVKRRKRATGISAVAVIVIAIIGAVILLSWQRSRVGQTPSLRTLARLTFDPGLQSEPTWSPDGKFVAYSSDQSGNFDIWIKPIGEGDPIQVTKSPAHDWQPDWSPDGQRLVFRSEREGGGLYVVPAFGGDERKISPSGYRPRWSPEGSQILFLSSALQITVEIPKLFVVTLDGNPPRQILTDFPSEFVTFLRVAWHPDGKRISLWGLHRKLGRSFWTAALAGGAPVKSDFAADVGQRLSEADVSFANFRWASSGRALFFEGISHEVRNLWRIDVDPQTLRWVGGPERLTTGSGVDTDIAVSPDGKKLAFSTRTERTRIWAVPTSPTAGAGQPITPAEMDAWTPDITPDGKKLVFVARRASKLGLWTKSLPDGREALLAGSDDLARSYPRWSRDGTRLVYRRIRPRNSERPQPEISLVLMAANGGDEQLLADLTAVPSDWSADGNSVLVWSERVTEGRTSICMLSTTAAPHAESQIRLVVSSPEHNLYNARFSPDERWIAFNAIRADDPEASTVYVVSSTGGEWKRITESKYRDAKPRWSPDGKTIYFVSNRGGFFNVWGVRFDPVTGQTQGESFRVTAFESPGRMVFPNVQEMDISIAGDRLVVPIMEVSGSIRTLENVDR